MEFKIDYNHDNTINLIASISNAIWDKKSVHPELGILSSQYLEKFDNIVLFVLDWLAYSFIEKNFSHLFDFYNHHIIHPVFPSATTPALTAIATWKTPQEHWLLSRYTFFKEIWVVTAVLPFCTRSWTPLAGKVDCTYFFDTPSIYESSLRKNYIFNRDYLINSDYSKAFAKNATRVWCANFSDLCWKLSDTILSSKDKKYCYCYDPQFDWLCHEFWINSGNTKEYADYLFSVLKDLSEKLKWSNSVIIITADHGMIDSTAERNLKVEDYPELESMLSMPTSWEGRVVFCYVKAERRENFEKWIKENFNDYCDCYKSSELLEKGRFWCWEIHKWFGDRLGDYALVMKENYILLDSVLGQKREVIIWNHWWVSKDENEILLLWKEL